MTEFQLAIKPGMEKMRKHDAVTIVGIYGMGGCGKSALAKHFFNSNRGEYQRSSFLFVGELCTEGKSNSLQIKLLQDLFAESNYNNIKSTSEWAAHLQMRLSSRRSDRFLIVIDNINKKEQLDSILFSKSLGPDSLVIVTTRDRGLLTRAGITICYEATKMKQDEGENLFCRHAFDHPSPKKGFKNLVTNFVEVCRGLPLSITVFGSHVHGRDKKFWESQLASAKIKGDSEIKEILKISYVELGEEEKQIFIDTACFFIGEEKGMALSIWEASGWHVADRLLQTLIDKCLVEVKVKGFKDVLDMHDHLRDLGRDLADEQSKEKSLARLWRPQDLPESLDKLKEKNCRWLQSIGLQKLITTARIGQSNGPRIKFFARSSMDCAPRSTDLLWLELDLQDESLHAIPSVIPMQNLQYLRVVNGHLKRLWKDDLQSSSSSATPLRLGSGAQVPIQLKELLLQGISLEEFPNSVGMLTQLENLFINYKVNKFSNCGSPPCKSFSETLRKLVKLKSLVVKSFPLSGELDLASGGDCLNELTNINISFLEHISRVSISGRLCPKFRNLTLDFMKNLIEVDLNPLESLESLTIKYCTKLKRISGSFDEGDLVKLNIMGCSELEKMPSLENLSSLEEISLDSCGRLQEISGIETLEGLRSLYISAECAGIWKCIQRMKKLPSEITITVGRAADGAGSDLNPNLFSSVISSKSVTEIKRNENGHVETLLITPDSLSAIVRCALVEADCEADFTSSITGKKSIGMGERILTFVFSRGTNGFDNTFDTNWTSFHAYVKQEYMVSVCEGDEDKVLDIFKIIIDRLYKRDP